MSIDKLLFVLRSGEFKEELHPRGQKNTDKGGQFVSKEGDGATNSDAPNKTSWIDHVPGMTYNTSKDYAPDDPERNKIYQQYIQDAMRDKPSISPEGRPVAIFSVGGPASGKSTFAKVLGPQFQSVHIDADEARAYLPEYQQSMKARARDAGTITQAEAQKMAYYKLMPEAFKQRKNIIIDGSGANFARYSEAMETARKLGYQVYVRGSYVDFNTAKTRAARRAEVEGRNVPDDVIHELSTGAYQNFKSYSEIADDFELWDNNANGQPPKLVWSGNKNSGQKIADQTFLNNFLKEYARH